MKKNLHIVIISFLFSVILWVSISLSNDYYATFNIPIKLVDFPEGYGTGTPVPHNISVKVKGKGWKLITANLTSEAIYQIPVGEQKGKRTINLYNYLVENQWLSSDVDEVNNISPDTISFYVEKLGQKRVKVESDLNLNFKTGYGLASNIVISPDTIDVTGPVSYLQKLKYVPTQAVEFDKLDNISTLIVPLKKIWGMSYDYNSVRAELDVQKIVDKNFNGIFVDIRDVPGDREVMLLPNRISIGVRGGINILGKLDTAQFNAYVSYRDVVLDTLGSVVPHVRVPENTTLLYLKPARLRYIIKKFN